MRFSPFDFLILFSLIDLGCSKDRKGQIVATIGHEHIYQNEVDSDIQNSLYELLFGIFKVRTIALENMIDRRVLRKEASASNVTVDSLIAYHLVQYKARIPIGQFIKDNGLASGVVDPARPFRLVPLSTSEGQAILQNSYHDYLKNEYLKRLREKYQVSINLAPPITPKLHLDGISFRSRGNQNAARSIWIISDFTCSSCQRYERTLKSLYRRYADKFQFKYVHFSSTVNRSMVFSECAGQQGKFWEAYDLLFKRNVSDSLDVKTLADQLGLDSQKCDRCIKTFNDMALKANMKRLADLKIASTPTILIDDRLYYGAITTEALDKYISDYATVE